MLFNSYEFVFLYLPITLGVAFLLPRSALAWLTLASIVFFAYWDLAGVPLLLASIAFNYAVGTSIARAVAAKRLTAANLLLAVGVGGDLLVLGWFKYAGFFGTALQAATGWPAEVPQVALPIGISFFTFTQIAFLVDSRTRAIGPVRPLQYTLFVSYFPHLVAGPIIHHAQVVPQFHQAGAFRFSARRMAIGGTVFAIGLFKKVMIADSLQPHVARVFDAPSLAPTFVEAWIAALAYTFQLYFDFSGYSDMAIGLSCMLGIWLPLNFASPYKATSIIDFWRRWHMSLSRFLRDYLYIPLGGNRRGLKRYGNILVTMVLGGLWHGAAWTFVVWGTLHGVYLVVNHAWRALRGPPRVTWWARAGGWLLTFVAVVVGWVFFRAASLDDAWRVLSGMAGTNGFALDVTANSALEAFTSALRRAIDVGVRTEVGLAEAAILIAVCLAICLAMPNTQEIVGPYLRTGETEVPARPTHLRWRPTFRWALAVGVLLALSLAGMTRSGEFMYFQF